MSANHDGCDVHGSNCNTKYQRKCQWQRRIKYNGKWAKTSANAMKYNNKRADVAHSFWVGDVAFFVHYNNNNNNNRFILSIIHSSDIHEIDWMGSDAQWPIGQCAPVLWWERMYQTLWELSGKSEIVVKSQCWYHTGYNMYWLSATPRSNVRRRYSHYKYMFSSPYLAYPSSLKEDENAKSGLTTVCAWIQYIIVESFRQIGWGLSDAPPKAKVPSWY